MPTLDPTVIRSVSRSLWNLLEPIASSVYFLREAQDNYAAIGVPDARPNYFCSRSACMGQVPGEVVVATFGVFNPAIVLPAVEAGYAKADAPTFLDARLRGARDGLTRLSADLDRSRYGRATELMARAGDAAAGAGLAARPLFAGLRSLGLPGDEIGDLWRTADVLREHRGDSHVAVFTAMSLTPVEVVLLTELWWRGRSGRFIRTRGWDQAPIDAGLVSLRERGFITDDEEAAFTPAGEELRGVVEEMTDGAQSSVVAALADDFDELTSILAPLTDAILAAKAYPRDPAAVGRM